MVICLLLLLLGLDQHIRIKTEVINNVIFLHDTWDIFYLFWRNFYMNVDLQHFPDFKLMEINRTCTRLESFGWRLREWSRKNARETVYITAKRWLKTAVIYLRNGDLFQKRKSRQRFLLAGEKNLWPSPIHSVTHADSFVELTSI